MVEFVQRKPGDGGAGADSAARDGPRTLDEAGSLRITYQDPAVLRPRARNPRTHSKEQIRQIGASIKEFGFVNPILVDRQGGIIAGHGRVEAAKLLGRVQVPTVRVDHLSPAQIRAYVIADNKLAENAGWDKELLAVELKEISLDLDFDVAITGFETPELDVLLESLSESTLEKADEIPQIDRSAPPVSQQGDLWRIGGHRLLCGDATKRQDFEKLFGDERAQMVFVDPPYNLKINGHVSGLGRVRHTEFMMASGKMSPHTYTEFLKTSCTNLANFSTDGSIHFVCMDWRHLRELLDAAAEPYAKLLNLCVWAKTNAGMGSLYRSQHELVFVFKNGCGPHINNVELGKHGRYRTNVWTYGGMNSFGEERESALARHPTTKPIRLAADAILDCSHRRGIVLDSFAGSGTTLIAAERTGRRGYAIEIDPYYADTIIKRFAETFGLAAYYEATGLNFAELAESRAPSKEN
jgi:DNA modification methylase